MKRFLGVLGIALCATAAQGAEVSDLINQLQSGDNDARRAAAKALGEGGAESKAAVPALIAALKDHDTFVRRFSAQALGEIGPAASSAVRPLTAAVDDPKKEVRSAAANALGKLGPSGIGTLIGILRDESKDTMIRRQAISSLGELGPAAHSAVPALTEVLKENAGKGKKKKMAPENLRTDAAIALGSLAKSSDTAAIETLSALTDKKAKTPRDLRQAANMALRKIRRTN